jgi:hypothetical protein
MHLVCGNICATRIFGRQEIMPLLFLLDIEDRRKEQEINE